MDRGPELERFLRDERGQRKSSDCAWTSSGPYRTIGNSLTDLHAQDMLALAASYNKSVQEEATLTAEQLKTRHVGKLDPKRHLEDAAEKAMGEQVTQNLAMGVLAEL